VKSRPALAAITLAPLGGGVAAVSRLLAQVLADGWGAGCPVVTLTRAGAPSLETGSGRRLGFGARLTWLQASGQCDWLVCTHLSVARAQGAIPPPVRRPYAVFLHGIEAWRPLSEARRRALAGAAVVLTNSAYTAARVLTAHPWVRPPVVCPLALPTPVGPPPASRVDPRWGPHAVLVVGRLDASEQYKGHDQLIEAFPMVRARVPDARLVFVGGGNDRGRLETKARAAGLGDAFLATGFLDEAAIAHAYARAAVFALPSRNEGFGVVYLEAMAHGLPCIGSIHDAAREVIVDGRSGFLVDQASLPDLAGQITRLLGDAPLRRQMGAYGQTLVTERFSYPQFRERVAGALAMTFEAQPEPDAHLARRATW
jgi:phosphatidylinositol alpha-1,6-mannosyltransferase